MRGLCEKPRRSFFDMNVTHEGRATQLLPRSYPIFSDSNFLLKLESNNNEEFIYLSIPGIYANVSKILATDYSLKIYKSNYWQEKTFSKLRIRQNLEWKPVGYLFPLTTLGLRDSLFWEDDSLKEKEDIQVKDKAEDQQGSERTADEITRGHALAAIIELLKSDDGQKEEIEISWGETYELSDFYDDSLVLAIYSTKRINSNVVHAKSMIEQYSISIAEYKTFEFSDRLLKKKGQGENFIADDVIDIKFQNDEKYKSIIDYLKSHLIPYESTECDPIIRFFLQYQFFELLMQEVFSGVIKEFLVKAAGAEYAIDAWKTKELVSKLNEKSSENYRISKIFSFMKDNFQVETDDLNKSCIRLLKNAGKIGTAVDLEQKEPKNPYYKVRNLIFHGFGSNNIDRNDINDICNCVAKIIFSLSLVFQDPTPYFELNTNVDPD